MSTDADFIAAAARLPPTHAEPPVTSTHPKLCPPFFFVSESDSKEDLASFSPVSYAHEDRIGASAHFCVPASTKSGRVDNSSRI